MLSIALTVNSLCVRLRECKCKHASDDDRQVKEIIYIYIYILNAMYLDGDCERYGQS